MPWPTLGTSTIDVSGTDRQVGTVLDGGDKSWQVSGIVGEVGIHFAEDLRTEVQPVVKSGCVGGPEALFGGAMKNMDAIVGRREFVGDCACPVGGPVIDDKEVVSVDAHGRSDCADVLRFVVRGDDDEDAHTKVLHVNVIGGQRPTLESSTRAVEADLLALVCELCLAFDQETARTDEFV